MCLRREPYRELCECIPVFVFSTDGSSYQAFQSKKTVKGKNTVGLKSTFARSSAKDLSPNSFRRWDFFFLIGLVLGGVGLVSAEVLTTTDFESESFSGWTAFPTPHGTLGGKGFPSVSICDHAGLISSSRCFQVQVGQLHYVPGQDVQQGGGIELTTMTGSGYLQLSARVSVTYDSPNKKRNP